VQRGREEQGQGRVVLEHGTCVDGDWALSMFNRLTSRSISSSFVDLGPLIAQVSRSLVHLAAPAITSSSFSSLWNRQELCLTLARGREGESQTRKRVREGGWREGGSPVRGGAGLTRQIPNLGLEII
jgi:hypothetical protein